MKYHLTRLSIVISVIFLLGSCTSSTSTGETSSTDSESESVKLTLTKAPPSPEFGDAKLLAEAMDVFDEDSSLSVNMVFAIENYELGIQTPDAAERGIANSGKGQHIHLIVNNGPYSAHYEAEFTKGLEKQENVVLAFLSRSYHESVKNPDAFFLEVLPAEGEEPQFDKEGEHMFYSRPKGTYSGSDTEKLMIDFYLINTSISPDGNKVRATVNGEEFMIDVWAPYYVEGLPKGTATVKLELIDSEGNPIPGPFNVVERDVTLE